MVTETYLHETLKKKKKTIVKKITKLNKILSNGSSTKKLKNFKKTTRLANYYNLIQSNILKKIPERRILLMKTKRESVINKKFYKTRIKGLVIAKNKLKRNSKKIINKSTAFFKKKTMDFGKKKLITLQSAITTNSINFLKKKRKIAPKNTLYKNKKTQKNCDWEKKEPTQSIMKKFNEKKNEKLCEKLESGLNEIIDQELENSIGLEWYNIINKKSSEEQRKELQEILDRGIGEILDQGIREILDQESDEAADQESNEVVDQESDEIITPSIIDTDCESDKENNLEQLKDDAKPYPNDKNEIDKIKTTSAVKFLFNISNILVRSGETDINHIKNKLNYNFKSLTKKTPRNVIIAKTKSISKVLKSNNIGNLSKHRNTKLGKKSTIGLVGMLLRKSHSKVLEIFKQEELKTDHNTFSIQNRVGDISMGLNNVSLRVMSMIGIKSPTLLIVNRIKNILARLPKKTGRLVHKTNFIFTILMLTLYLDTNVLATFVGESFYKTEFGRQRRLFYVFRNAMGPITSACAMYSPIRGIYLGFRGKIATKAGLRKKRLSTRHGIYSSSNFGLQHKYRFKTI